MFRGERGEARVSSGVGSGGSGHKLEGAHLDTSACFSRPHPASHPYPLTYSSHRRLSLPAQLSKAQHSQVSLDPRALHRLSAAPHKTQRLLNTSRGAFARSLSRWHTHTRPLVTEVDATLSQVTQTLPYASPTGTSYIATSDNPILCLLFPS